VGSSCEHAVFWKLEFTPHTFCIRQVMQNHGRSWRKLLNAIFSFHAGLETTAFEQICTSQLFGTHWNACFYQLWCCRRRFNFIERIKLLCAKSVYQKFFLRFAFFLWNDAKNTAIYNSLNFFPDFLQFLKFKHWKARNYFYDVRSPSRQALRMELLEAWLPNADFPADVN
jgi:hypothetical protein